MRPIISHSIVVPHIIKGVRIIEAVAAIVDGILRHFLLVLFCSVKVESCGVWWVDDILEPRLGKAGVAVCYTSIAH